MGYSKGNGNQTTTSSEADITGLVFSGDFHYSVRIFIGNLGASDTIQLRVYMWDPIASAYSLYSSDPYSGNDSIKALHFAFTFEEKIKFTVQRTAGTDKQINYAWVKSNP